SPLIPARVRRTVLRRLPAPLLIGAPIRTSSNTVVVRTRPHAERATDSAVRALATVSRPVQVAVQNRGQPGRMARIRASERTVPGTVRWEGGEQLRRTAASPAPPEPVWR